MKYGHQIDAELPEGQGLGRFEPEPWGFEADVWIKTNDEIASTTPVPVQTQPFGWRGAPLGQAPAISQSEAGLEGYVSPNAGLAPSGQAPPDADAMAELERLRGWSECDQAVHSVISWTTRKCYPIKIGIALGNDDMVGRETHEVQFWEERQDFAHYNEWSKRGLSLAH
jgi:hypothetical protein